MARLLKARAIVAFTQSGFSARLISQERPDVPIIALTPFVEVQRRLALCWGVSSRLIAKVHSTEEMIEEVERALLADGTVTANDIIVIISGAPHVGGGNDQSPQGPSRRRASVAACVGVPAMRRAGWPGPGVLPSEHAESQSAVATRWGHET